MKLIWGFFVVLLIFFVVVSMDGYQKQLYAHDHYKPVDAVITRSEDRCSGRRSSKCHALIEYSYSVAGKTYQSSRYAFISRDEPASDRVARYPLHGKVTAYVDPADPSMATLNIEPWSVWQVIGILCPFVIIGLIFIMVQRRQLRRRVSGLQYMDRQP